MPMTNTNPPKGVYPRKHRRGKCPHCNVEAFYTPFFTEKSIQGYKFRMCWCNICGDKWTEARKLTPTELRRYDRERKY